MKISIIYLLLMALLGIIVSASIAQQNQNVPKTDTEVEALKVQLQTVKNEKIGLETKLAEANAKLINTEIDKLKGELRESNNDWLRAWNNWFLGIVGVIAVIIGAALWLVLRTLIEKGIEKRLDGFKDAVEQMNILEDQLKVLNKAYAVSVLENYINRTMEEQVYYRKHVDPLSPETLNDIFYDKKYSAPIRQVAASIMIERKIPQFISSYFELINSAIDTDIDDMEHNILKYCMHYFRSSHTDESYQELKKFLERLLTEKLKHKDVYLTSTVFVIAEMSIKMNTDDSINLMLRALPCLDEKQISVGNMQILVEYFMKFQQPQGIKEILKFDLEKIIWLESKCLEILQELDPEFLRDWKAQKENANTQGEGNS